MVSKTSFVCAVGACNNYANQKNARTFHRFPRDQNKCAIWVHKCGRSDLDTLFRRNGSLLLNKNYRVCSDHFQIVDYNNPNLKSQGLKKCAVPTANLGQRCETPKVRKSPCKRKTFSPVKRRSPQKLRASLSSMTESSIRKQHHADTASQDDNDLPRDARLPKRKPATQEAILKRLRMDLQNSRKREQRQSRMIQTLKKELQSLKFKVLRTQDLQELLTRETYSRANEFIVAQMKQQKRKRKGRRYTAYDKDFALALHYCSPQAYRLMAKIFCLPTVRSLQNWLQNIHVFPGVNESVFSMLKIKAQGLLKKQSGYIDY